MNLTTITPCPACRAPMDEHHVRPDHGRPGVRLLVCRCGVQTRHEWLAVDEGHTPGAPSQQIIDAIGFVDRRAG